MDAFAALPSVAPPACSGADDGGFSEFDEPAAVFDAFETSDISAPSGSSGFDGLEPATAARQNRKDTTRFSQLPFTMAAVALMRSPQRPRSARPRLQ